MFKVNNKDIMASFWCLYCLNIFLTCSSVSIVNFEYVIADWEVMCYV